MEGQSGQQFVGHLLQQHFKHLIVEHVLLQFEPFEQFEQQFQSQLLLDKIFEFQQQLLVIEFVLVQFVRQFLQFHRQL